MKTQLKVALVSLIAATSAALLAGCGNNSSTAEKIGLVLVGDETEGYTKAHMDGIAAAATKLGISDRLVYRKKVLEDSGCKTAIDDLIAKTAVSSFPTATAIRIT